MKYKIKIGIIVAGSWSICIIAGVYVIASDINTEFLQWGPSDVIFAGFRVNTWTRWGFVISYSVLSQVAYTIVNSSVLPYITNVIRDHKTPIEEKGTKLNAQIIVFTYTLFYWLSSILDVFLWITLQLQYILPALLTDLLITIYFTNSYMTETVIFLD